MSALEALGLPTKIGYGARELAEAVQSDKKRSGSSINLIIPRAVGRCEIRSLPMSGLEAYIEKGL